MMSTETPEKDKPDPDEKPEKAKVPPSRGRTFGGRGVEKQKG